MKKLIKPLVLLSMLGGLLFLSSCASKKKDDPIPLVAKAGEDQTVKAFATVTLDGSTSTGPNSFSYEWKYNGAVAENLLGIQNKFVSTITFVPPKNGIYNFTLTVTSGNLFSTDDVVVTVSGVVELGGTLADNLALLDIEPDPTKPDYKITSDFTIPSGKTLSNTLTGVVIEVSDNVGIQIQGGTLVSSTNGVRLFSATGWKGILLSSGALTLGGNTTVENAGKSTFTGQTEAAAITVTGGTLTLTTMRFAGTTGYDLLMSGGSSGSTISAVVFSTAKPLKMGITHLPFLGSNNSFGTYDYVTLTTPGASTSVSSITSSFAFPNAKFYIDGDLTASSPITINSGATIYMKAGTGIVASGGMSVINTTFDGLSGAPWKGITLGGSGSSTINTSFIKNAGSDVFNTGSLTSPFKTAVYFFSGSGGGLSGTEISDSKGYGVYVEGTTSLTLSNCTIKNSTLAGVSAPINSIHQLISGASPNTFTMNSGVPAVEVQSVVAVAQPVSTWNALGGANYYLFLSGVVLNSGSWTLAPGVNFKFKSGKTLDVQQGLFKALGTANSPITFDSQLGTPGTWPGILLESNYNVEFCTIKNGGEINMFKFGTTPATEKANVVFNYAGAAANTFKNNTISGGVGYGTLIESGKVDPLPLSAPNNNTFSGNTLGTSITKP